MTGEDGCWFLVKKLLELSDDVVSAPDIESPLLGEGEGEREGEGEGEGEGLCIMEVNIIKTTSSDEEGPLLVRDG